METDPILLPLPPEEGAARVARRWLADARAAAERLAEPEDAEALHDFRVALRRLRGTLRSWRRELPKRTRRRKLATLQRQTGAARDAEVALVWLEQARGSLGPEAAAGAAHLAALLEARHREAMGPIRGSLRDAFVALEPDLREALGRLRVRIDIDGPRAAFGARLARKLRRAARRLPGKLVAVSGPAEREAGHAARLAGKRLRILLEPVGAEAEACRRLCKQLQDRLGELNDAHVLTREIEGVRKHAAPETRAGLAELSKRLDDQRAAHFEALERDWRSDGAARLLWEVELLARHCEQAARPPIEIERKYLLRSLPDLSALRGRGLGVETLEIEQGWLPGRTLRERLRRTRSADGKQSFRRTVKLGAGVERVEIEEETSREVFETLWPLTEGCRVRKRRHQVREGEWLWEIDEFLDRPLGLAEVELPDPEIRPALPDWLDVEREVTDEAGFTNLALAR